MIQTYALSLRLAPFLLGAGPYLVRSPMLIKNALLGLPCLFGIQRCPTDGWWGLTGFTAEHTPPGARNLQLPWDRPTQVLNLMGPQQVWIYRHFVNGWPFQMFPWLPLNNILSNDVCVFESFFVVLNSDYADDVDHRFGTGTILLCLALPFFSTT